MDGTTFDDLVSRIFRGTSRRDTVKGVLAGAVAGVPVLAEAKTKKGKGQDTHRTGTGKKAKAHNAGKPGKNTRQVRAAGKKPFCLCPGTIETNCTATNCVNCVSQGEIGKNKRKKLKQANPLSFVGECPAVTTTSTTTSTTTTTRRPTTTTRPPGTTTTTTTLAPNACPGGPCTGSCDGDCLCVNGFCAACRPAISPCLAGELCCSTAAECPADNVCP